MKYYVYVLTDGDVPIYVGKGTGNRMYKHRQEALSKKRNTPLHNRIRKMLREGRDVGYEIVHQSDDAVEAFRAEITYIQTLGRKDLGLGPLLNLTDGGEGANGCVWTAERKDELSRKIKLAIVEGRFNPAQNAACQDKQSDEYREARSQQMLAYYDSAEGIKRKQQLSALGKEKLDGNGKRKDLSEEGRRRLSEARRAANLKRAEERKCSAS